MLRHTAGERPSVSLGFCQSDDALRWSCADARRALTFRHLERAVHDKSCNAVVVPVKRRSGLGRHLSAAAAGDLPLWARLYIRGTRFYDAHRDQWFAVFEPDTADSAYAARRAAIVDRLGSLYSRDDVVKVTRTLPVSLKAWSGRTASHKASSSL